LRMRGMVDGSTQTRVAGNNLVVAAAKDNHVARKFPEKIEAKLFFKDFTEVELVVMNPDVLHGGKVTKEALQQLGMWNKLKHSFVRMGSSSEALYLTAKGNRVGILYASDVVNNPELKLLTELPEKTYSPIVYDAVVVAGDNMRHAREFMKFLREETTLKYFETMGLGR
jgi:molybdenum ABC transporter molybdate-binding protein